MTWNEAYCSKANHQKVSQTKPITDTVENVRL